MKNQINNEHKNKLFRLRRFLICILGENDGNKRYLSLVRSHGLKVLCFKYGKIEGTERYNKKIEKDKIKGTLPRYIEKYGEVVGTQKYYDKNRKLSVGYDSLKAKGLTDAEILEIKKSHSENSKTDLDTMVRKYGEEEGNRRHKLKLDRSYSCRSISSVMRRFGLNEQESVDFVGDRQRRDLTYYVSKYGEEEGHTRYDLANLKRSYSNTLEYFIDKYGEDIAESKYSEFKQKQIQTAKTSSKLEFYIGKYGEAEGLLKFKTMLLKKASSSPNSLIQGSFSKFLYNILPLELRCFYYGFPINNGFIIPYIKNQFNIKTICPDVRIKNLIIEFDGDYWHSKPEVIEKDRKKDILYEFYGFKVLRVRECDYNENNLAVMQTVTNFIFNNIDIEYSFAKIMKDIDENQQY